MKSLSKIEELTAPGVNNLIPYQPGKPIEELQRELGLSNIVKLASNENPLGPSPKALTAMKDAFSELARYPDGNGFNLKRALSAKYDLEERQITLGNGSNEILEIVARTFLTVNTEAVFSKYAFAVYPIVTQAVGATSKIVQAKAYGHDLKAMREAVSEKTRVVFIANPNNPTGTLLEPVELQDFVESLPGTCICVLDEAYYEFISPEKRSSSVDWLNKCPNLIITRTFSKAYGLAGLRIGYSLSSPEIAGLLNKVRQPFNINSMALVAAEAALSDQDHLRRTVDVNNSGMNQLTETLNSLGLDWIPSAGNFITINVTTNGEKVFQKMLRKGVIVRPIAVYDMPNHIRVSIGTHYENQQFLQALESVLKDV